MTGQVKEDFLSRMRELGIYIENGEIAFRFSMINPNEFLVQKKVFEYFDLKDEKQQIILNEGQLGFTFCQVPVIYTISQEDKIKLTKNDGTWIELAGNTIKHDWSVSLFERDRRFSQIEVSFRK
jgi:hypothetical protein